jgi:hypothetical protein
MENEKEMFFTCVLLVIFLTYPLQKLPDVFHELIFSADSGGRIFL